MQLHSDFSQFVDNICRHKLEDNSILETVAKVQPADAGNTPKESTSPNQLGFGARIANYFWPADNSNGLDSEDLRDSEDLAYENDDTDENTETSTGKGKQKDTGDVTKADAGNFAETDAGKGTKGDAVKSIGTSNGGGFIVGSVDI